MTHESQEEKDAQACHSVVGIARPSQALRALTRPLPRSPLTCLLTWTSDPPDGVVFSILVLDLGIAPFGKRGSLSTNWVIFKSWYARMMFAFRVPCSRE